jgi:hypothetical protein
MFPMLRAEEQRRHHEQDRDRNSSDVNSVRFKKYWADARPENRKTLHFPVDLKSTQWQYQNGVADGTLGGIDKDAGRGGASQETETQCLGPETDHRRDEEAVGGVLQGEEGGSKVVLWWRPTARVAIPH